MEEVREQTIAAKHRAQDPNRPKADAVPDEIWAKVADLLGDALGNGKL